MVMKKKSLVCALAAITVGGMAPVAAQEQAPVIGQATAPAAAPEAAGAPVSVVVTGSRIQRRDASGVGPMLTMTKEDISFAAPTSVGDMLQVLPSVGVSLNSNGTQGTSFGVSSINLRYLGSAEGSGNRTLVLVDGHRWVNAAGGRGFRDFVDLNTIPLGIIDHIEVPTTTATTSAATSTGARSWTNCRCSSRPATTTASRSTRPIATSRAPR
jgi:iron complex outermembrane receptor protein